MPHWKSARRPLLRGASCCCCCCWPWEPKKNTHHIQLPSYCMVSATWHRSSRTCSDSCILTRTRMTRRRVQAGASRTKKRVKTYEGSKISLPEADGEPFGGPRMPKGFSTPVFHDVSCVGCNVQQANAQATSTWPDPGTADSCAHEHSKDRFSHP